MQQRVLDVTPGWPDCRPLPFSGGTGAAPIILGPRRRVSERTEKNAPAEFSGCARRSQVMTGDLFSYAASVLTISKSNRDRFSM